MVHIAVRIPTPLRCLTPGADTTLAQAASAEHVRPGDADAEDEHAAVCRLAHALLTGCPYSPNIAVPPGCAVIARRTAFNTEVPAWKGGKPQHKGRRPGLTNAKR